MKLTFYSPTFLDFSLTHPDRRGHQRPTGNLSGVVIARRFAKNAKGKITATREIISFAWGGRRGSKVAALAKAIEGMEELPGLDNNPPLNWIPQTVKEKFNEQIPEEAFHQNRQ